MLIMIALSVVSQLVGMAMQVVFYAAAAYYVMKYGRKGWKASE
jgi:hypothetical protein